MGLLDFFKKQKEKEERKEKKEKAKKPSELKLEKKIKKVQKVKKISELAFKVLKEPHITEKATDLAKLNQYLFKVYSSANKTEIKKAIESLYGVTVLSVNIVHIPKKERRLGRIIGFRKSYKKAIVKIKKGQKIEIMPR